MPEKNNPAIALNVLYVKKVNILPTFQNNLNHENQILLLMIPNRERWHCLAVKTTICIIML